MKMDILRRILKQEQGAVAVVVASLMVLFIGLSALVVDMGYAYSIRRQLQTAADAAALAGCRALIEGLDNPSHSLVDDRIRTVVNEYAGLNAVPPGDGLSVDEVEIPVSRDYVKVTVSKDATLFFGGILQGLVNRNTLDEPWTISAQAKAQIGYLGGMSAVVPWGAPIIRANHVEVEIDGQKYPLQDQGQGKFVGTVDVPSTVLVSGGQIQGYRLDVHAYNGQTGFVPGSQGPAYHTFEDVARVIVKDPAMPLADVYLDDAFVDSDGQNHSRIISVETTSAVTPRHKFDNKGSFHEMALHAEGVYRRAVQVSTEWDDLYRIARSDITVGGTRIENAVPLVVKRSTHPLENVELSRRVFDSGSNSAVTVTVQLHEYKPDTEYVLKVGGGGAVVGNFAAIDLSVVWRLVNGVWQVAYSSSDDGRLSGGNQANPYGIFLTEGYYDDLYINDVFETLPGVKTGDTKKGLVSRFGGEPSDYSGWKTDKPPSNRVVFLPVVEKMEIKNDAQPNDPQGKVQVVDFAAFYISQPANPNNFNPNTDPIVGYFIEYAAAASGRIDGPPTELTVMAPYLVSDGVDF